MRYSKQIHTFGIIKTAVKQGDKEHVKNAEKIEKKNHIKDICLNCTQPKCTRGCKAFKKEVKNGREKAD